MFVCEHVHTLKFPCIIDLPPRLLCQPLVSLPYSFKVDNREGMFVYRDSQGRIHYFFLTIEQTTCQNMEKAMHVRHQNEVVLSVYGVDPPSLEITQDLRLMLENKLEATTLLILSNLIARNQLFKLTPDDVDFYAPHGRNKEMDNEQKDEPIPHITSKRVLVFCPLHEKSPDRILTFESASHPGWESTTFTTPRKLEECA